MKKPFFDEAGLQEVLQELYSLSDQQLSAEVRALELNFIGWINLQFELTPAQQTFFNQMNAQALKFLTQQCSFAVENRLPITLNKANGTTGKGGEEGDKLFEPKSKLHATADADGNFTAGGSLEIEVHYE